ncbi:hypothetical protein OC834_003120 [Tilletia horrida]|uniref:Uncharacterized protein n=1 Tax=Tilletia horrida TaxID=155126 RepID=A0AAN6JND7_9BASI|nr:hypothetical protein OC834_003120 [Tilletia horrida]KAK0541086.1 hypothetical protein OC842_000175 [Tilletia horrida]KAK0559274.1 hypothetical protein OC844_004531 [Tilletia horrida]
MRSQIFRPFNIVAGAALAGATFTVLTSRRASQLALTQGARGYCPTPERSGGGI